MPNVKISGLTAKAAALATTDTLEINESGTSKSVTGANIIDAIASASQTLTNKTFDANATGNSLSNVDVADLSDGVDGELITWNASGAPAVVAVGTDGQLLTSTGAGSPPAFEDAPAGGAGYFLGNSGGATGDTTSGLEDVFRVNSATVDNSCTIAANTNASCTGPLSVSSGVVITVSGVLAVI